MGRELFQVLSLAVMYFLFLTSMYSQQEDLVLKAEELVYSNPNEAIKIANLILNTSQKPQVVATANLLLSTSFFVKGDYNNAIIYAFDNVNQLDEIALKTRIENNILKAKLLRNLYLDNQSTEYLNKASLLVTKLTSEKDLVNYQIALEHINFLLNRLKTNEAVAAIENVTVKFDGFLKNNRDEQRAYYLVKEKVFNDMSKYDSAFVYIDKTIDLLNITKKNNLYEKAHIYKELGILYLQKKEFKKSTEALFIALRFAEILGNPFLLEQINREVAINYLASNQKSQHNVYYEESLTLNNKVEEIEEEAVNTFYNINSNQEEKKLLAENQKYANYLNILLMAALFTIVIGVLILLKSVNRKKRKREIINYLDISRNNFTRVKPILNNTSRRMVIPEETEQNLLLKLKRFEKSRKYLNKDMSLSLLAGQFETNTKYLSEIINKNYNDNFNSFINKLRINHIIEKLRNDPNYINYKISFLAEESGFSSHSSFATVFKSILGMSPATFINLLKTEREEINKSKETK